MLSVIVPSIRPQNLERLYTSIEGAYSGEFEFIVVGPNPLPEFFYPKRNARAIIDYGSPTRAQQIGLCRAVGDWVLWGCADDGYFYPGSVDRALVTEFLQPYPAMPSSWRKVVVGKYYEGEGENPAMNTRDYYYINTHNVCRSTYIAPDMLMFMLGVASRQLLIEVGGIDTVNFETLPMAFNDLSVRLYHAGAELVLQHDTMFRCSHMPGHEGDHGPVHDGQTLHDEAMFRSIYNDASSLTLCKIPLDNWKQAPARWERRFGPEPTA